MIARLRAAPLPLALLGLVALLAFAAAHVLLGYAIVDGRLDGAGYGFRPFGVGPPWRRAWSVGGGGGGWRGRRPVSPAGWKMAGAPAGSRTSSRR